MNHNVWKCTFDISTQLVPLDLCTSEDLLCASSQADQSFRCALCGQGFKMSSANKDGFCQDFAGWSGRICLTVHFCTVWLLYQLWRWTTIQKEDRSRKTTIPPYANDADLQRIRIRRLVVCHLYTARPFYYAVEYKNFNQTVHIHTVRKIRCYLSTTANLGKT